MLQNFYPYLILVHGPTDALKYRGPAIVWTLSLLVMLAGVAALRTR